MASIILDIFKVIFFKNILIWPFQLSVPRLCSFPYLVYSRGQHGPTCAASLRCLLFQCPSQSIILTLSHKGRWFPFSFHIWSAIPNFSISPCNTAFRYSCSLTFKGRHVLPLYILSQLHGMEYTCYVLTLDPAQRNAIPRWCTGRKWHIPTEIGWWNGTR